MYRPRSTGRVREQPRANRWLFRGRRPLATTLSDRLWPIKESSKDAVEFFTAQAIAAARAEFFVRLLDRYSELHVKILVAAEPLPPFILREESFGVVDGEPDGVMRDLLDLLQQRAW